MLLSMVLRAMVTPVLVLLALAAASVQLINGVGFWVVYGLPLTVAIKMPPLY